MIGLVLAAGSGQRLRPFTDALPKTLVPIGEDLTILDIILRNFADVGLTEAAIVVGYAAEAIENRLPLLKERYGLSLTLIYNDRYDWNNCYSLWLARGVFAQGGLLVNGDTLHASSVDQQLLNQAGADLLITVDQVKTLTGEAMKVQLTPTGQLTLITKEQPVDTAAGEYIGVSLIPAQAAAALAAALEQTWRRDPNLYYEDGYQLYVDKGGVIRAVDPGKIDWVEVDDLADLSRAREIVCRY